MPNENWLPYVPLLALVAAGFVALPRAWAMRRRGVSVLAADWERTIGQMVFDTLLGVALLFWLYLVVAETGWLPIGFLPGFLSRTILDGAVAYSTGIALLVGWPIVYWLGVRAMGQSWRLGIDREACGPLVTDGIFRFSRNPIYLAFNLLFWGTALVDGRVIHVVMAVVLSASLHVIILREERFLAGQFGQRYNAYRQRVGRYVSWHR